MMNPIDEALNQAWHFLQAGHAAHAGQICRQVLQADPSRIKAWFVLGNACLAQGNAAEAEASYRHIIHLAPELANAPFNLGLALQQQGRLHEAADCYRQALRLRPGFVEALDNLGTTLALLGATEEARVTLEEAVRADPGSARAHNNLGKLLHELGRPDEAEARFRQALQVRPDYTEALFNLGLSLEGQERFAEAAASYQQALGLRPNFTEALNNLGTTLARLGKPAEAQARLEEALHLNPGYTPAINNLGKLLQDQGQCDEAEACFRRAVQLRPDYAAALFNLGVTLEAQRRLGEAVASYQQALRLRPDFAEALNNLGNVQRQLANWDDAEAALRQAVRVRTGFAQAHTNLGSLYQDRGRPAEAEAHLREALRLRPSNHLRAHVATLLPPVYESLDDLHAWRSRLTENLRRLHADGVTLDLTHEPAAPPFFLAYQGQNDRDLQRDFARLCRVASEPPPSAARGEKIRIGFLSSHFHDHTIGRLFRGAIATLSRGTFHVTALTVGKRDDETSRAIRRAADAHVEVPANLPAARRLVAGQRLDVLFYPDLGMDPFSYALAFSRLAPVQCVCWGHPVTTGIGTIDYFLSSEALETEAAEEHYTETLVRLKALPVHYYRPAPPPARGRGFYGLPADANLYACPQSLFKLHPEFDAVLGGVLRRDPRGVVALLHGRAPHWDELLLRRFAVTMPDVTGRVHFVPPLSRGDFLGLLAASDVLLDPLHFGGGNTSYEAFALGVPVVTLPSAFLRGRITLALYRQMGVTDCVAASVGEYIDQAVRLGTDRGYRDAVREKIRDASPVLYEDAEGVRELEAFFERITTPETHER
jgi:predicted O-linked N-acetylglucosamine transferase (SPINDLY family)